KAYKKTFAAGSVTLGGAQNGGTTGALRNWFAVLKPTVKTFEEGPMSQTEFVHDRDADGDGLHDAFEAADALNPWVSNSAVATLPDEDKTINSISAFQAQVIAETPAPSGGGGGGGGGGCGLMGFEYILPLLAVRLRRRRD